MSEEPQITFYQGSDVGRVREHNEDHVLVEDPVEPEMKAKGRLFIVADGMGGYQAGEVASEVATEVVQREYYASPAQDPVERLRDAIQAANREVHRSAQSSSARTGMGTTVVAAAVLGPEAYIASVGDSRVYLLHQGQLSQITQDHSFVAEQVRAGILTKEQARLHPQRNVITRALGSQPNLVVDTFVHHLSEGDVLLLCSDGLTGHVTDDVIRDTVMKLPPAQAVQRLIKIANDNGGTDNISVIVARVGAPLATQEATVPLGSTAEATPITVASRQATAPMAGGRPRLPRRGPNLTWVVVGIVVALLGLGVLAILVLGLTGLLTLGALQRATPTATLAGSPTVAPTVMPLQTEAAPAAPATAAATPTTAATATTGATATSAATASPVAPTATLPGVVGGDPRPAASPAPSRAPAPTPGL